VPGPVVSEHNVHVYEPQSDELSARRAPRSNRKKVLATADVDVVDNVCNRAVVSNWRVPGDSIDESRLGVAEESHVVLCW
jgi:hypothetical protein